VLLVVGCSVPPSPESPSTPALVDARAAGITFGTYTGCLWTPEGGAACWGGGCDGALPGSFLAQLCSNDTHAVHDVAQVSVEDVGYMLGSVCFLDRHGAVSCWRNYQDDAPVRVPIPRALELASSSFATCARLVNGDVTCWGLERKPGIVVASATSLEARNDDI